MTEESQALTEAIGHRLRAQRQAIGLSLSELSERTGRLSKSRISNYEQGIRRMGVEEAEALANALGTVSAAYLLHLEDEAPFTREEVELIDIYRRLSPEVQRVIRRAIGTV